MFTLVIVGPSHFGYNYRKAYKMVPQFVTVAKLVQISPMSPVGLWLIYLYYIYIWFINQETSLWLIDRTSYLRDYKPTFTSRERGHHLVGSYQRTETHEKKWAEETPETH